MNAPDFTPDHTPLSVAMAMLAKIIDTTESNPQAMKTALWLAKDIVTDGLTAYRDNVFHAHIAKEAWLVAQQKDIES